MKIGEPVLFHEVVAEMQAATVRPEIKLGPITPPQRLAPFSYALGAEVDSSRSPVIPVDCDGDAFGHLILLYDPQRYQTWGGLIRMVAFIQADLDPHEAHDPLLPEVSWSWLVEVLHSQTDDFASLAGTVTTTTSIRYGEMADHPPQHQLELRASWTATTGKNLQGHVHAFCGVLERAAGLPPADVIQLSSYH